MRGFLVASAVVVWVVSELSTVIVAVSYFGILGLAFLLLGPIGSVAVSILTGQDGPIFYLVVAALLGWAASWGAKS